MNKDEAVEMVEKLDAVRADLMHSMLENDLKPNEALTLLTSMLVQIYYKFAEDNSRDNFVAILGKSYETYELIEAEPMGGLQ